MHFRWKNKPKSNKIYDVVNGIINKNADSELTPIELVANQCNTNYSDIDLNYLGTSHFPVKGYCITCMVIETKTDCKHVVDIALRQ